MDENGVPLTPAQELALARTQAARRVDEIRSQLYRRLMGLALGKKPGRADLRQRSQNAAAMTKNTAEMLESAGGFSSGRSGWEEERGFSCGAFPVHWHCRETRQPHRSRSAFHFMSRTENLSIPRLVPGGFRAMGSGSAKAEGASPIAEAAESALRKSRRLEFAGCIAANDCRLRPKRNGVAT